MVDMDSMYGPMSWLRLHAAGKQVIGLTTAQRTQTDFRLGRPFDSHSFSVRSEEHTSELPSLMRTSYAVFCLEKKTTDEDETVITPRHRPGHQYELAEQH